MADLSPERWRLVSPYLDEAMELSDEARAAWLAQVRARDATLADDLEALLDEHGHAGREGFLEGKPPSPSAPSPLAGQTVGDWTLASLIGQGGMGNVWLARRNDGRFEGRAAVKLLNASLLGRAGEERFRREGDLLARLADPHIARLLDAGVSPSGQPYLVLEYVEGEPIDRHCDARKLDVDARIRLFLEVLEAVAHAHANLIVHRDIKPSNVLVGGDGQAKLLDFGIAKLLEGEGEGRRGHGPDAGRRPGADPGVRGARADDGRRRDDRHRRLRARGPALPPADRPPSGGRRRCTPPSGSSSRSSRSTRPAPPTRSAKRGPRLRTTGSATRPRARRPRMACADGSKATSTRSSPRP